MSLRKLKSLIQKAVNPDTPQEEATTAAMAAVLIIDQMNLLQTKTKYLEGDTRDGFQLIRARYEGTCANPRCQARIGVNDLIWWRPTLPAACHDCHPRLKGQLTDKQIDSMPF